jgi:hypothetical protein
MKTVIRQIVFITLAILMFPSLVGIGKLVISLLAGGFVWTVIYLFSAFSLPSILLFLGCIIASPLLFAIFVFAYFAYYYLIYSGFTGTNKFWNNRFLLIYGSFIIVYLILCLLLNEPLFSSKMPSIFSRYLGLDYLLSFLGYPILVVTALLLSFKTLVGSKMFIKNKISDRQV